MKGLILAGGTGSRLMPMTLGVCKQLLPVYNKPLIFYPLATLMSAGIREIALICRRVDLHLFKELLGDGSTLGITIDFVVQQEPRGIAEAFILSEGFLNGSNGSVLILGDNIFHGPTLDSNLNVPDQFTGARIFAYQVSNPHDYGVVEFHKNGSAKGIEEKPKNPQSSYAVTGLYVYDANAVEIAKSIRPSSRGELEITDVNRAYLESGRLEVITLPRGTAWLDTGTCEALADANAYIRAIEARQGTMVGCLEEIAWRRGWISGEQVARAATRMASSAYGQYLEKLLSAGAH